MFNKPEPKNILRKCYAKLRPFQAIARYSCDGDLESTLNEYLHLLKGSGMALRSKKRDGYSAEERLYGGRCVSYNERDVQVFEINQSCQSNC